MPFRTKLYSNHTNLNGVFLQFGWKNYISKFWKIISSFQKYSWLLFTPIILITKLSNVWRDVNMRTSNSPLRHMCVLSTRTYPKRSKRTTSSTRITMWSHLNWSIAVHRDHFVRRLSIRPSVCLSVRLCVCPLVTLSWSSRIAMFRRRHMHSSEWCHYVSGKHPKWTLGYILIYNQFSMFRLGLEH